MINATITSVPHGHTLMMHYIHDARTDDFLASYSSDRSGLKMYQIKRNGRILSARRRFNSVDALLKFYGFKEEDAE